MKTLRNENHQIVKLLKILTNNIIKMKQVCLGYETLTLTKDSSG
jgi:hypothetical protein